MRTDEPEVKQGGCLKEFLSVLLVFAILGGLVLSFVHFVAWTAAMVMKIFGQVLAS